MSDELVIFFPPIGKGLPAPFQKIGVANKLLSTPCEVANVYSENTVLRCVTFDSAELVRTVIRLKRPRRHRLLLLEDFAETQSTYLTRLRVLQTLFADVIRPEPSSNFLEPEDLVAALTAPHASELAIAVSYDEDTESICILRGSLETLVIPSGALCTYGEGPKADLSQLQVEDCGQTLKAGDYEASMDALLYEFDGEYRRRLKKKRREEEQSLGASLRRARLQKGLRQSDFIDVSMKEVARIESGEVSKPRSATLKKIAEIIGVGVDELGDF